MTETKSFLQRIPLTLPVFVLIAALYVGWVFYSRWRDAENARKTAAVHEIERARKDVELNGGSQLKVTMLTASAGTVHKGKSIDICYGVVNAKNVAFDPPIGEVWPSMSRCLEVSPKKSTTYTLTADDGAGHQDSAKISIKVE